MSKVIPVSERISEDLIIENLREMKEVFDKAGIEFWLNWGTLLGIVRDGKLIPWDNDIDLATMENNHEKIMSVVSEFKKRGFIVREAAIPVPGEERLYRKFAFYRHGYPIDVGMYHLKGEKFMAINGLHDLSSSISNTLTKGIWLFWDTLVSLELDTDSKRRAIIEHSVRHCLRLLSIKFKKYLTRKVKQMLFRRNYCDFVDQVLIPKQYYEKLDKIQFHGINFNTPSDIEGFLRYRYGDDWKIVKVDNWDPRHDEVIKPLEGCQ